MGCVGSSALVGDLLSSVSRRVHVCARTIGQRLDKTEQCSDWGRRPLRREQLLYAALDALILILVHDSLVSKASSN